MKNTSKGQIKAKKRTQNDCTIGFKLAVFNEVEKGPMTYKQLEEGYTLRCSALAESDEITVSYL